MTPTRELKDRAAETVKELAADAGEKLRDKAETQKVAGADRVRGIADAIRRAADAMEAELPLATPYVRRAAAELDTASDTMRRRDLRELVRNVQDFARRNPAVFIGGSVLAGMMLVRFVKTSSQGHYEQEGDPRHAQGSSGTIGEEPGSYASDLEPGSSGLGAMGQPHGETSRKPASGDRGGFSPEAPGFSPKPAGSSL